VAGVSSSEVIALVAVVSSGLIGLASLGFNFWNAQQERGLRQTMLEREQSEQYRVGLYERRLQVHQDAFEFVQRIGFDESADLKTKQQLFRDSIHWWSAHAFYLDPASSLEFAKFVKAAAVRAKEGQPAPNSERVTGFLLGGIGLKHFDTENLSSQVEEALRGIEEASA
jgi:hypothetical protein